MGRDTSSGLQVRGSSTYFRSSQAAADVTNLRFVESKKAQAHFTRLGLKSFWVIQHPVKVKIIIDRSHLICQD